jgi:hypothetical protein
MPSGNDCPRCGRNIGIGAVFKAPVPNRIYCPHCGERLRYGDTAGPITAAVFFLFVLCGIALVLGLTFRSDDVVLACAVPLSVVLVGGAALEVTFVLLLWFGRYRLEPVNRPKDDWDDEAF